MSENGISRRNFLQTASATVATSLMPTKTLSAVTTAASKSPFAKYALTSVASHILPFFTFGSFFGDEVSAIDIEMLHIKEKSNHIYDLIHLDDLATVLDRDFNVPDFVEKGVPFKMGHLLANENVCFFKESLIKSESYFEGDPLSVAQRYRDFMQEDVSGFIGENGLDSIEDIAKISVKDFYDRVYRPLFKQKLDGLMEFFKTIPLSDYYECADLMGSINDRNLSNLKKSYPDCADKLDDVLRYFDQVNQQNQRTDVMPIGHIRVEKQLFGQYRFSMPSII